MRIILVLLLILGVASGAIDPNQQINWSKTIDHTITLNGNPIIGASNITDLEAGASAANISIDALSDSAYVNETAINSSISSLTAAAYANETAINSSITTMQGYVSHLNVIAGGAAGNHTLTGVAIGDELGGVLHVTKGAENLTGVADLGSEFTILDDDVIENAGHTNTTGGYLIVSWINKTA